MKATSIELVIDGDPVSWLAHAGFGNKAYNPRYTQKCYTIYTVQAQLYAVLTPQLPYSGPVSMEYVFHLAIAKNTSKQKLEKMKAGEIPHIKRPDCTNMQKFYEDCLKNLVYKDDSQVVESVARKCYSDHPRTVIKVKLI